MKYWKQMSTGLLMGGLIITCSLKQEQGDEAFLKALAKSKHSLADGILMARAQAKQGVQSPETAISAKFEMDDKGEHLMLSVYTAEKGLDKDAEDNVLKEYNGSAEGEKWNPEIEVFKDVAHVARSAQQQTLMSLTSLSLADIIKKAEKDQPGTVFSVTPTVHNHKAVFAVQVAANGKAVELLYDLMTGKSVKLK